jgi:hypothetical protein
MPSALRRKASFPVTRSNMRLAAQVKGGYYPAPRGGRRPRGNALEGSHRAVHHPRPLCRRRSGPSPTFRVTRLPAVPVLRDRTGRQPAAALRATLPDAHVLAPAEFFACQATFFVLTRDCVVDAELDDLSVDDLEPLRSLARKIHYLSRPCPVTPAGAGSSAPTPTFTKAPEATATSRGDD